MLIVKVILEHERFPFQSLLSRNCNSGGRSCDLCHRLESRQNNPGVDTSSTYLSRTAYVSETIFHFKTELKDATGSEHHLYRARQSK